MLANIELPSIYAPVLTLKGRIAVEHAHLDARGTEAMVTKALSYGKGHVVIFTPHKDAVRWVLSEWLKIRPVKVGEGDRFDIGDLHLFAVHRRQDVHIRRIDQFLVCDAHKIADNPLLELDDRVLGDRIICGAYGERGHWWYLWAERNAEHRVQIPYDQVLRLWPEQRNKVPLRNDPFFERHMLLQDKIPRQHPFRVLARQRLKVRTEKGPEYLSKSQQREAYQQLGEGWQTSKYGTPIVTLELSPIQNRYLAMKRLGRMKGFNRFILLKYRRGGFTTLEQAQNYLYAVNHPNSYVATIAHKDESTKRIFKMSHLYREWDPKHINSVASKTEIRFDNGSYFFIGTAGGRGSFRGDSIQRIHGSEAGFWGDRSSDQESLVGNLMSSINAAAKGGEVVLESTPNSRNWFYEHYVSAKNNDNGYFPIFFRWFDDPANVAKPGTYSVEEILDDLRDDEKELMERARLGVAQIAFRRSEQRQHGPLFPQEWPEDDEECFLASGTSYFSGQLQYLLHLHKTLPNEDGRKKITGGTYVEWEAPQHGVEYVAGCDTSEGIEGCDKSGVVILRKDNGAQVADLHGLFPPPKLAELAVEMCAKYNDAMLGIERQNHGHAVIQRVIEKGYSRPHFVGGPLYYFGGDPDHRTAWRAGWDTNEATRPQMLATLAQCVEERALIIRDKMFVGECLSFRLQRDGKFRAASGSHDDRITKNAIALQMRMHRKMRPMITILDGTL